MSICQQKQPLPASRLNFEPHEQAAKNESASEAIWQGGHRLKQPLTIRLRAVPLSLNPLCVTRLQIIWIERNIVKNPSWPEANQLAINKHGWGFELGATEKQIQVHVVTRAGLEPQTAGWRVRRADDSATLPPDKRHDRSTQ